MRTRFRVPQEATNALVQFRADDVFEFAGLRVRLVLVDAESILEQPLRQPVAPHYIARAVLPAIGELYFVIFPHLDQPQIFHPRDCPHGINASGRSNMLQVRAASLFSANPDLLQQMIEVDAVIHRNALVNGQVSVSQLDLAIRLLCDFRIMCHHQNRVAGAV
jgi:hypothetical protein